MAEEQSNLIKVILIGLFVTVLGGIFVVNYEYGVFGNENKPESSESKTNPIAEQTSEQNSRPRIETNPQNFSTPRIPESKEENYSPYINSSLTKSDISVIIVDEDGNISNSIANAIADIYQKTGKNASIGLIRNKFIKKAEFKELFEGNSTIIQKLNLGPYADYLAIGKISYKNRAGNLVSGTIICTVSISMNIVSVKTNSLKKSFKINNVNGNGVDELQAKEDALGKLLDKYFNDYSSF